VLLVGCFAGAFKKATNEAKYFLIALAQHEKCLHKIFQFEILPVDFVGFII